MFEFTVCIALIGLVLLPIVEGLICCEKGERPEGVGICDEGIKTRPFRFLKYRGVVTSSRAEESLRLKQDSKFGVPRCADGRGKDCSKYALSDNATVSGTGKVCELVKCSATEQDCKCGFVGMEKVVSAVVDGFVRVGELVVANCTEITTEDLAERVGSDVPRRDRVAIAVAKLYSLLEGHSRQMESIDYLRELEQRDSGKVEPESGRRKRSLYGSIIGYESINSEHISHKVIGSYIVLNFTTAFNGLVLMEWNGMTLVSSNVANTTSFKFEMTGDLLERGGLVRIRIKGTTSIGFDYDQRVVVHTTRYCRVPYTIWNWDYINYWWCSGRVGDMVRALTCLWVLAIIASACLRSLKMAGMILFAPLSLLAFCFTWTWYKLTKFLRSEKLKDEMSGSPLEDYVRKVTKEEMRRTSGSTGSTMLVVMCVLGLVGSAVGCDDALSLAYSTKVCTESGGSTTCSVSFNDLVSIKDGRKLCLTLDGGDAPNSHIEVTAEWSTFTPYALEYRTAEGIVTTQSTQRCATTPFEDNGCQVHTCGDMLPTDTSFFSGPVTFGAGRTTCETGAGPCSIFAAWGSCLVGRWAVNLAGSATLVNSKAGPAVWALQITVKNSIDGHPHVVQGHTFFVGEGEWISTSGIGIEYVSGIVNDDGSPEYYVHRNSHSYYGNQGLFNPSSIYTPGHVGDLQFTSTAIDLSNVAASNIQYSQQMCVPTYQGISVHYECAKSGLKTFFDHEDTKLIPSELHVDEHPANLVIGGVEYAETVSGVLTGRKLAREPIQLRLRLPQTVLSQDVSLIMPQFESISVHGCYDCADGFGFLIGTFSPTDGVVTIKINGTSSDTVVLGQHSYHIFPIPVGGPAVQTLIKATSTVKEVTLNFCIQGATEVCRGIHEFLDDPVISLQNTTGTFGVGNGTTSTLGAGQPVGLFGAIGGAFSSLFSSIGSLFSPTVIIIMVLVGVVVVLGGAIGLYVYLQTLAAKNK